MHKRIHQAGFAKRVLSLVMAIAMLLSLAPAGLGITAKAADSDTVTVHYYNVSNWPTVAGYVWQSSGSDSSGWPGDVLTENADHPGWYDLTVTDTDGSFCCIFNNNNGGAQTGDITVDHSDGTTEFWFLNNQLLTVAPDAWTSGAEVEVPTIVVHYQNSNGWSKVNGYVWNADNGNSWPGVELSENAANSGWFDLEVIDTDTSFSCVFNDGTNQTDDILVTHNGTIKEFWYVGEALTDTAPEGWMTGEDPVDPSDPSDPSDPVETDPVGSDVTVHYYNADGWAAVSGYWWEADTATVAWPGTGLSENAGHPGWFDLTVTDSDGMFNCIFNNGAGGQTSDIAVNHLDGTTEFWFVNNGLTKVAPGLWTGEEDPDAPAEPEEGGLVTVGSNVKVKIGEELYQMYAFENGFFGVTLPLSGTGTGTLVVDGVESVLVAEYDAADGMDITFLFSSMGAQFVATGMEGSMKLNILNPNNFGFVANSEGTCLLPMTYIGGSWYDYELTFAAEDADRELQFTLSYSMVYSLSDTHTVTIPAGATGVRIMADGTHETVVTGIDSKYINGTKVELIGTVREDDATNWSTGVSGWEFDQISDHLYRFQKTFDVGTYEYKSLVNGAWYPGGMNNNHKVVITQDDTSVIFLYDTLDGVLCDSVSATKVTAQKLGMNIPAYVNKVYTEGNGFTTFVAAGDDGCGTCLFYGDYEDIMAGGEFTMVSMPVISGRTSSITINLGEEAVDILFYIDIAGNLTLVPGCEEVEVDGVTYNRYTRAAVTGRDVYVPGTFPGPSWDAASNKMTYLGNGIYEYTFKNVPAATYSFKIAIGGGWDENYGVDGVSGGDNLTVRVPKQQDVTVWYSDISHLAVTSVGYEMGADISLSGTGIADGTKMTDPELRGIYSAKVSLAAGTYADVIITYGDFTNTFASFTLESAKDVTFYYDPATGLAYHDGSDVKVDASALYFSTQNTQYKSIYGAVPNGTEVTFSIETGSDVTTALMVIPGMGTYPMEQKTAGLWSVTLSFDEIGEYTYYFALSNGSDVVTYGDDDGYYGVGTAATLTSVMPYDLVVYDKDFTTPDWMKNAVIYQIFPDRFFDGDTSNNDAQDHARGEVNYEYIPDWYMLPENPEAEAAFDKATYLTTGAYFGDGQWSNEIYGGDLKGITERIGYLKALGVNVIYLNPVFSSISSHRYDACDYTEIDPILGTLGDFTELVEVAEANGMHIILDGVFNHVSDDSIYFDRYYRFLGTSEKIGAYPYWAYVYDYMTEEGVDQVEAEKQAKLYFGKNYGITDYSYTEWFEVYTTFMSDGKGGYASDNVGLRAGKGVYGYQGWWGYDSMPVIKSTNGSEYQSGNWAQEIIGNEDGTAVGQYWLSQGSNGWRLDVANEVSDETWQRFRESVKALDSEAVIIGEIWDDATYYLLGDMYDSVMNYQFRNAVTSFATGTSGPDTQKALEKIRERYPEEAFYAMMNLVGSHDTTRILSYLDGHPDDRTGSTASIDKAYPTYETTSDLAKARQYLVAFLQFTYPGAPTLYYGDEIGMVGIDDPDDRRAMEWGKGNKELVEWYAKLAAIRAQYPALRTGNISCRESGNAAVLAFDRYDAHNHLVIFANNSQTVQRIELDGSESIDLVTGKVYTDTVEIPAMSGVILISASAAKTIDVDYEGLKPAYDPAYIVGDRTVTEQIFTIEGNETVKAGDKAVFTVDAIINTFEKVLVDGNELDDPACTVKTGVTVTLSGAYTKTLSAGAHTIRVVFNGGYAEMTFTVDKPLVSLGNVNITQTIGHATGNILYWDAVENAVFYQVYRLSADKTAWELLTNTASTGYKDTTAPEGVKSYYKIVARNGNVIGSMANATSVGIVRPLSITKLEDVTGLTATAHKSGNIISWNAVKGAKLYQVYRLSADKTTWELLKNTGSLAYKDETAQVNVRHYYKVIARSGDIKSSMNIASVSAVRPAEITALDDVKMIAALGHKTGIIVSWNAVENAALYQIYRRAADETTWTLIKNTGSLAYKDTTAEAGVKYYYKVVARNGNIKSSMNIAAVSAIRPK